MNLPSIFDYLPDDAEGLVKTALNAGLMGQLKNVAGAGAKIGLKRGGEQFAARSFNAEAAALTPKKIMGTVVADPFKVAFAQEKPKEPPSPTFSKNTLKNALKTTAVYGLGSAVGAGLGEGVRQGLNALERHRGKPLVPPPVMARYGPAALMALGGLLASGEYMARKHERELWRKGADESPDNGAAGKVSPK